jgi:hypothetical protein
MPLSWNEIKARAFAFSKEWSEDARKAKVAESSQAVLDTRASHLNSSQDDL